MDYNNVGRIKVDHNMDPDLSYDKSDTIKV